MARRQSPAFSSQMASSMTHCPKRALQRGGGRGSPLTVGFRASDEEEEFVVRGPGLREGLFLMRSSGGNASLGRGGSLG